MDIPLTGACLIGRIRVKDAEKWATYCSLVPATLTAWGAALVSRGAFPLVLSGTSDETDMVVIRFPDIHAIDGWFRSAAYQALIPNRDAAADVVIVAYGV
ncbi:MAG: DUF1330 domain-containing protein [Burkholderiaceae bacterium]